MILRLDSVSKCFGTVSVLQRVSFTVGERETVGLLGASGSGKTTILRLIVGALCPDDGHVTVLAKRIGYVFQESRLLPWRTARQNIAVTLRAVGAKKQDALVQADEWLQRVGLGGFERYYPAELSGGMLQRVSIGRALALLPDLLLMDEPFSALHLDLREALMSLVEDMIQENTLATVYVTHHLSEALRLADRVLCLTDCGGIEEMCTGQRERLVQAFLGSVAKGILGAEDDTSALTAWMAESHNRDAGLCDGRSCCCSHGKGGVNLCDS